MSRPNSSVPHQCRADGPASRCGRSIWAGSCGAMRGAKMAKAAKIRTSTAPIAARGLLRVERRSAMAVVDIVAIRDRTLLTQILSAVLKLSICSYLSRKKEGFWILTLTAKLERTKILEPGPIRDFRLCFQPSTQTIKIFEADIAVAHAFD